jgi:hypothetical protein
MDRNRPGRTVFQTDADPRNHLKSLTMIKSPKEPERRRIALQATLSAAAVICALLLMISSFMVFLATGP